MGASTKEIRKKITPEERTREKEMLRALFDRLYDEKTFSDDSFGESTITLKWSGGVLALVTVTDTATHKPIGYRRHSED